MAVELPFATPDFDRIRRDAGIETEDAIRLIWLLLQDEINRRERLAQSVGGTTGHNLLSATHPDTIPADPIQGDIIVALGSTPVDAGRYFLDGEQILFVSINDDTKSVSYWIEGDAFLMDGFDTSSGSGTKWQRKALGPAGTFWGSDGTKPDWLSVATASESASVYRSTTLVVPSATDTAVDLTTAHFDTAAFWSAATPSRLTIPTGKGGKYLIVGQITWDDEVIGTLQTRIRLNGSTILASNSGNTTITGVADAPGAIQASVVANLGEGDYVELVAYWRYTDTVSRTVNGGERVTFIQLVKVG